MSQEPRGTQECPGERGKVEGLARLIKWGSCRIIRRPPSRVSWQIEGTVYFEGSTWRLFVTENTFGTLFA